MSHSHLDKNKLPKHGAEKLSKSSNSHWHIIDPVKQDIIIAMAFAAISSACSVGVLVCLGYLIKSVLQGQQSQHVNTIFPSWSLAAPWQWFIVALVLVIVAYLLRGLGFKRSHLAAFELEAKLRRGLSQHLTTLPLGVLNQQGASTLAKVMQDDVKELHVFVADATPLYAKAYGAPLFSFLVMLWVDWRLALVALSVIVVGMLILSLVMRHSTSLQQRYNQAREQVNQAVIEFVQAMPVVRTFDGGEASFSRYEKALGNYLTVLTQWYREMGLSARLSMIILNPMPTLLALLWFGFYWLWNDQLAFSTWFAILLLGTGMAEAIMPYMSLYHMIEKAKISINRIASIQDLKPLPSGPVSHIIPKPSSETLPASIRFNNVSFCYDNRDNNALSNISFEVPEGSLTALIGPSGSGKSTVARLILRFWDVTSGSIEIGGIDIRSIDPDVLMEQVAIVSQDNFLFSGTIIENVSLGIKDCTKEKIVSACKSAQAHEFISRFPKGYDTLVGERGASLSGGQRQRLTIARAILQDRPILILDEATAFADAQNEALLMQALHELMQSKTVILIAHRLASIAHADQILVFDQGKLVESGTPAQLRDQSGHFAKLYEAYQRAQRWTMATN